MGEFDSKAISDLAVRQAEQLGRTLDYTAQSIPVLEDILEYYAEGRRDGSLDDRQVWNLAVAFGTYLGETLLRNGLADKGYGWQLTDSGLPVLLKNAKNQMSPISKAEKRILNGPEDNVKSFYDIALLIGDGKLIPG